MKVSYLESFLKDLRKIKNRDLLARIKSTILQIEAVSSVDEIQSVRKLRGSSSYYRVRIGDYRMGLVVESGNVTLVRVLHRKDIYRYFPRF